MRVWLAQCLCPSRHAILAAAGEADEREEAEADVLRPLRAKIADMLATGAINPWCGLCKSDAESWVYEVGRTRFRSMEEATPELKRVEGEQSLTRLLFGEDRSATD